MFKEVILMKYGSLEHAKGEREKECMGRKKRAEVGIFTYCTG